MRRYRMPARSGRELSLQKQKLRGKQLTHRRQWPLLPKLAQPRRLRGPEQTTCKLPSRPQSCVEQRSPPQQPPLPRLRKMRPLVREPQRQQLWPRRETLIPREPLPSKPEPMRLPATKLLRRERCSTVPPKQTQWLPLSVRHLKRQVPPMLLSACRCRIAMLVLQP
ncbi:hypothetical protein DIPPA_33026 [Diplonema papillatum]|nr:hypothetical protein DIPPA_33026 [Diplonema papillatum]